MALRCSLSVLLGHAFSVPEDDTHQFMEKVYVVESAPFQLLLGVKFLHRHWAGIFIPWAKIVLCKPKRVEISCSITRPQGWSRLNMEVTTSWMGLAGNRWIR
ncbi:hypothetical protein BGX38DRAFT_619948 [Terfezia claveryi]|nr:hypothetical protein BGX38DRAFT_619948 [Terfezia claveryi]